ncbi:MAG TPA: hypothetical protein VJ608_12900 [Albitalea sp.]|nr:hypothetical protein [Albitalea sp.]
MFTNKLAVIIVVSIGLTIGANAQSTDAGVTESTDPAKAAAIEQAARDMKARLDAEAKSGTPKSSAFVVRGQTEGGLAYLSGGISTEDRTTMYAERGHYSLWVATVAKGSGAYLSDAQLRIVDLKGKVVVLERTMDGPWFFLALPAGRYEITATVPADSADAAQTLTTRVDIARSGQRQAVLRFVSSATVGQEMEGPLKGNPFGSPPLAK